MQLRWLKLSAAAESLSSDGCIPSNSKTPETIEFSIKKPFFTASVVLAYEFVGESIKAHTKLSAKIPIYGSISYSIEARSHKFPLSNRFFAFQGVVERDDGKGNYRKVTTHENELTHETSNAGETPTSKSRELKSEPPAPLLVHLLALPALQQTREDGIDIYVAQLVNGAKFQALRLDRLGTSGAVESYRGRVLSLTSPLNEEEFRDLTWESASSFEFDFDLQKNTIAAARVQLPIVGKIEIK